ncbi:hypothetical protein PV325_013258 [Microctonus aethiopoides]|nr:hypothetical protein PV325_013258 [Microctonus aethiopoides]KAK0097318.1 hypothetical protein PV326_002508 [Microctonus aethiopoides]
MRSSEATGNRLSKSKDNLPLNNKENNGHEETNDIEEYRMVLDRLKAEFLKKWKRERKFNDNIQFTNFEKMRTLGMGAFGRVMLVKHTATSNYYAMKILNKDKLIKSKQIEHTRNEKRVLQSLNYPFVVSMKYFFMDNSYLYMVLPFVNGGELFTLLRRKGKFSEKVSKFYAAQVLLALEYLHYCGLIYRDLKPENILLDCDGYLKITDFGFCKMINGRTWTLCGTPEYMAPEIILSKGYGISADWWSFGVLIYEMNAGYAPFYSHDPMKIYEKIVAGKFKFASTFGNELKDILKNTLQTDLTRRYGNLKNGAQDIKEHAWFHSIDFNEIYQRKERPIYVPVCKNAGDDSNFDRYDEVEHKIQSTNRYQKEFSDF